MMSRIGILACVALGCWDMGSFTLETSASGIIGVLVGISLIFRGVSWLMVGFALKRVPQMAA